MDSSAIPASRNRRAPTGSGASRARLALRLVVVAILAALVCWNLAELSTLERLKAFGLSALDGTVGVALGVRGEPHAVDAALDFQKAEFAHRRGDRTGAEHYWHKGLALLRRDTSRAEAFARQGRFFTEVRLIEEAVERYRKAIELDPKTLTPLVQLGDLYLAEGLRSEALAAFRRYASAYPRETTGAHRIARVHIAMNRATEALAALMDAHMIDPRDKAVLADIAWLHLVAGDPRKAEFAYGLIIEGLEAPTLWASLHGRADDREKAYYRAARCRARSGAGDFIGAIIDCTAALNLSPNHTYALRQRGAAYEAAGDPYNARADYKAALAREPTDEWTVQALARLGINPA